MKFHHFRLFLTYLWLILRSFLKQKLKEVFRSYCTTNKLRGFTQFHSSYFYTEVTRQNSVMLPKMSGLHRYATYCSKGWRYTLCFWNHLFFKFFFLQSNTWGSKVFLNHAALKFDWFISPAWSLAAFNLWKSICKFASRPTAKCGLVFSMYKRHSFQNIYAQNPTSYKELINPNSNNIKIPNTTV